LRKSRQLRKKMGKRTFEDGGGDLGAWGCSYPVNGGKERAKKTFHPKKDKDY